MINLFNMKVTMIPIVIDAHETVHKNLERGLEIGGQTTVFLRSARILGSILEI